MNPDQPITLMPVSLPKRTRSGYTSLFLICVSLLLFVLLAPLLGILGVRLWYVSEVHEILKSTGLDTRFFIAFSLFGMGIIFFGYKFWWTYRPSRWLRIIGFALASLGVVNLLWAFYGQSTGTDIRGNPIKVESVDPLKCQWFDPYTNKPLLWYAPGVGGITEFFQAPITVHPVTGQPAHAVTPDLQAAYFAHVQAETAREAMLERQKAEEKSKLDEERRQSAERIKELNQRLERAQQQTVAAARLTQERQLFPQQKIVIENQQPSQVAPSIHTTGSHSGQSANFNSPLSSCDLSRSYSLYSGRWLRVNKPHAECEVWSDVSIEIGTPPARPVIQSPGRRLRIPAGGYPDIKARPIYQNGNLWIREL